ncbi:hypothetical protein DRO97_08190 [Archaeoglobales archaeon]|nr:MAG: hypothetical protein DRO97_08190 [Archaeoglobales archaeon]
MSEMEFKYIQIFKEYPPSMLDELITSICPFYQPYWKGSSVYRTIHDIARARIAAKLITRGYSIETEKKVEFGRIDIVVNSNSKNLAIIEIKTGDAKLLQVAAYSIITQLPAFIVELKSGNVIMLDLKNSKKLLDELIKHLDNLKELEKNKTKTVGSECYRCKSNCENRKSQKVNLNPLNNLNVLDNIETVFEKLVEELEKIKNKR